MLHMDCQDSPWCSWCLSMHKLQVTLWCNKIWYDMNAQYVPQCCWMSWMFNDAQVRPWCTNRFIWLQLDVYQCTSYVLMQQENYVNAQNDPWCIWIYWISTNAQVDDLYGSELDRIIQIIWYSNSWEQIVLFVFRPIVISK